MATLTRSEQDLAWELRRAWAKHERVVLTLSERCMVDRVEGTIKRVAVTGAFVVCNGWHIPTVEVLGMAKPHFSQAT